VSNIIQGGVSLDLIETGVENFMLRFAQKKDTALILWFIKELAIYEEELDQVTATEDVLEKSLFERKGAEVIIADYDGKPVGFALFHQNFSTFLGRVGMHLVDLYVIPEMRGMGFGKIILSFLAKLTVERNLGRLEWGVHDWNDPAIRFYKNLGAFPLEELRIYRLCGEALNNFSQGCKDI
jgi:GNAT superfamily N-acetyltransferase